MNDSSEIEEVVESLQQLGLKEYEARCFVALSRVDTATAKRLSNITEVPRTRVYDAVRALESWGLVEIQHSSPQQYSAVPLEVAIGILRGRYKNRIDRVYDVLEAIDPIGEAGESRVQEVWSISGRDATETRAEQLVREATDEVVLVVGHGSVLTEGLVGTLSAVDEGVELIVGAITPSLRDAIEETVPEATTFVSGLEWLRGTDADDATVGRLLLVDRSALLVSSVTSESGTEKAVFGTGFGNGLIVVARRLMSQGLVPTDDSAW